MSAHAVAPDSVHVWRGFKTATKPYPDFAKFLGSVFVPACALLQPNAGLRAYVPTMMPRTDKPAGVPDQTALMFWSKQEQHQEAFKTVAVRAYTNLHGDAYDTTISSAQFPIAFAGIVEAEQPYFLTDRIADWMLGHVYHYVGGRPPQRSPADHLAGIARWAACYTGREKGGIDNALLVAGNDYVALWEHGASSTEPFARDIATLATTSVDRVAETYHLPAGLWDAWDGIDLDVHSCINIQLERRMA